MTHRHRHVILMTADDIRWARESVNFGWRLPEPACWLMRSWGFRHARIFVHTFQVVKYEEICRRMGRLPGMYGRWVLYAIRRGWC